MSIPRETLQDLQGAIELVRIYLEDLEHVNLFNDDLCVEGNESAIVNARTRRLHSFKIL
jgi:hypothetical protein